MVLGYILAASSAVFNVKANGVLDIRNRFLIG